MATRIQLRRGTAAEWASVNPVLADSEPGFETDTRILRIGDGITAFTSLTPIITVGSINQTLEQALVTLDTQETVIIENIESEKQTAINTVELTGQYYTDICETIAAQLSSFQSTSAYLFNSIDGGNVYSVYSAVDMFDGGDSEAEFDANDVVDGDNAKTSHLTSIDIYVDIAGISDLQDDIDAVAERCGTNETNITTVNNKITQIQNTISSIQTTIGEIQTSITGLSNSITSLSTRITNVETTINGGGA
jgi:flagellin-like hook-associated protein FlgL